MRKGRVFPLGLFRLVFILSLTLSWFLSNPAFTNPSVIYVPDDYSTIQAAVDAASPGDTIIVRDGTYTENVVVNKDHLTIRSENGAEVTIVQAEDPNSDIFSITADNVVLQGFMIRGATLVGSGEWPAGIHLNHVNHCSLFDNVVSANSYGIRVEASSDNTLSGNSASDNGVGIGIGLSPNNILRNNSMSGNDRNFDVSGLQVSDFIQNIDISNTVNQKPIHYILDAHGLLIDSSWNIGYLALVNCSEITVRDLIITNNGQGVLLVGTQRAKIENVSISQNGEGIALYYSNDSTLRRNIASDNGEGMFFYHSTGNYVYLNNLIDNVDAYQIGLQESSNTFRSPAPITYLYNGRSFTSYLGNYWNNYTGSDADGDGIGDTSYSINSDQDNYPLMGPFENYGVAKPICSFPQKGDCQLPPGTTVIGENEVTGIEEGDLYIPSDATLHLNQNATFIWNPGNSIIIDGVITKDSGAEVKKGYLCVKYNDQDGCWFDPTFSDSPSCPTGYMRWKDVPVGTPRCSDSIQLVSIVPSPGTVLQRGTSVNFEVTVAYSLYSVASGFVGAELGLATGEGMDIGRVDVEQGSGTVTIQGSIDVDYLYESIPADTVYLALLLGYRIDPTHSWLLIWQHMPDYSYFISELPARPPVLLVHGFQCNYLNPDNTSFDPVDIIWKAMAEFLTSNDIANAERVWDRHHNHYFWHLQRASEGDFTVYISNYSHDTSSPTFVDIRLYAYWLAEEIQIIKEREGVSEVDIVAHSMGGLVTRAYVENEDFPNNPYGTSYEHDVRKLIMLGTPNHGVDLTKVYPYLNFPPGTSVDQMRPDSVDFLQPLNSGITGGGYTIIAGIDCSHCHLGTISSWTLCRKKCIEKGKKGIGSDKPLLPGWFSAESTRLNGTQFYPYLLANHSELRVKEGLCELAKAVLREEQINIENYWDFNVHQYRLIFKCPVNVTIKDQYDRVIDDQGTNEIPEADVEVIGEEKIFYLPPDLTYKIDIEAYNTGDFTLVETSPITNKVNIFYNVGVISRTKAMLEILPSEVERTMEIDFDGDGITDKIIKGTIVTGVTGDINGDGALDATDVRWTVEAILGLRTLTKAQESIADIAPPSGLDSTDVRYMVEIIQGLRSVTSTSEVSGTQASRSIQQQGQFLQSAKLEVESKADIIPGEAATLQLSISKLSDPGLADMQIGPQGVIKFDPKVIQVKSVKGVGSLQVMQPVLIDNQKGEVRFIAVAVGSKFIKEGPIIELEVRAVGKEGESSPIEITGLDVLRDGEIHDIKATIVNGKVTLGKAQKLQVSSVLNIPNPVTGRSAEFRVEGAGIKTVQVEIYDLSGQRIFNSGEVFGHTLEWNLQNDSGNIVANGVYLYLVTVRGFNGEVYRSSVKKLVVLR